MEIEVKTQYSVGGATVAKIVVSPISFSKLVGLSGAGDAADGTSAQAVLMKSRMREQASFIGKDGKPLTASDQDIDAMPLAEAKAVRDALDEGTGDIGSLVQDGDGISSPAIYRLAKPISLPSADGETEISEIEFQATTLREAQEVLAEDSNIRRAKVLLETIARPVGVPRLMKLPLAAVEAISVADGVGIMRLVVPKF